VEVVPPLVGGYDWQQQVTEPYQLPDMIAGTTFPLENLVNNPGGVPLQYETVLSAEGISVDPTTGIVSTTGAAAGAKEFKVQLIGPTVDNWEQRISEAGVVWYQPLDNVREITAFINPGARGPLGVDVIPGISSPSVTPHIMLDGEPCLEISQIGGRLAAPMTAPNLTVHSFPAATLTVTGARTATISLPLTASSLAIESDLSLFKLTSGVNSGLFLSASSDPVVGTEIVFNVFTSDRTPFVGNQTGLTFQYSKSRDAANPYEEIVINEFVDEVGEESWASPTGWVPGGPIPQDAYCFVVHMDTSVGGLASKYKEKLTCVKKVYDPVTKLSTLTVQRNSVGTGTLGRIEKDIINQFFPCEFPSGTVVGVDTPGGFARPLAALPALENGLDSPDPAARGSVRTRSFAPGGIRTRNFRTGYYGHEDYHNRYPVGSPFLPNSIASNGEMPFDGNEFWLAWSMKFSPLMATRSGSTKLFFIDQHQNADKSQIVGSSITAAERSFRAFHNYGSAPNSFLTAKNDNNADSYNPNSQWANTCTQGNRDVLGNCWWPPLGEWFDMLAHFRAGHDNCMEYNDSNIYVYTAAINGNQMTITTGLINLAPGMIVNGGYPVSAQNPLALNPRTTGYFDNWRLAFKGATAGGGILAGKDFNHVVDLGAGVTTFVVEKLKPTDSWPPALPAVGDAFKLSWIDKETSARYYDSQIEFYKKETADVDWVPVMRLPHPITFNGGTSDSSAGNPPGWNSFQPTGYANINDNSPPGPRSIYTRFRKIIFSKHPIAARQ
jgi:hypothetical protein